MLIFITIVGTAAWMAIVGIVLYLRQTPQAKVRRRILMMIEKAESEREKSARLKKALEPEPVKKIRFHRTFYERIIKPILKSIEEMLHSLTPPAIKNSLENYIFRAGKYGSWSVQRMAAIWALSVAAAVFLAFALVQNFPEWELLFIQKILALAVGGIIGALLPFAILNSKIRKRQKELRHQLPEFMDLLCVSVQAGLSFDGAVAKITGRMRNTLSDEFRHMQDDIRFGMTKQYSLTQMAKRCDIEEVYLFTTSVIQAEKLGTSMAQTLTLQADNMRDRHRQFVKSEAMKAPVKMLFPMVLFIFPAIFVVLLMPSVITLVKTLGK